jgi:hypothetical protein
LVSTTEIALGEVYDFMCLQLELGAEYDEFLFETVRVLAEEVLVVKVLLEMSVIAEVIVQYVVALANEALEVRLFAMTIQLFVREEAYFAILAPADRQRL